MRSTEAAIHGKAITAVKKCCQLGPSLWILLNFYKLAKDMVARNSNKRWLVLNLQSSDTKSFVHLEYWVPKSSSPGLELRNRRAWKKSRVRVSRERKQEPEKWISVCELIYTRKASPPWLWSCSSVKLDSMSLDSLWIVQPTLFREFRNREVRGLSLLGKSPSWPAVTEETASAIFGNETRRSFRWDRQIALCWESWYIKFVCLGLQKMVVGVSPFS